MKAKQQKFSAYTRTATGYLILSEYLDLYHNIKNPHGMAMKNPNIHNNLTRGYLRHLFADETGLSTGATRSLRRKELNGLSDSANQPLQSLHQAWLEMGGVLDLESELKLFNKMAWRRMSIVSVYNDLDKMIYLRFGIGITIYAHSVVSGLSGIPVSEQPDQSYGRWVAESYREVARSGRPQFAEIDATVQHPEYPPRRRAYDRLILPWKRPSGDKLLVIGSVLKPMPQWRPIMVQPRS